LARENSSSGTAAFPPAKAPVGCAAGAAEGGDDGSAARMGATARPSRRGGRGKDTQVARRRGEAGAGSTASARTACAAHCTDIPPLLCLCTTRHISSEVILEGSRRKIIFFPPRQILDDHEREEQEGDGGRVVAGFLGRVWEGTSGSPTNERIRGIKARNKIIKIEPVSSEVKKMNKGLRPFIFNMLNTNF